MRERCELQASVFGITLRLLGGEQVSPWSNERLMLTAKPVQQPAELECLFLMVGDHDSMGFLLVYHLSCCPAGSQQVGPSRRGRGRGSWYKIFTFRTAGRGACVDIPDHLMPGESGVASLPSQGACLTCCCRTISAAPRVLLHLPPGAACMPLPGHAEPEPEVCVGGVRLLGRWTIAPFHQGFSPT